MAAVPVFRSADGGAFTVGVLMTATTGDLSSAMRRGQWSALEHEGTAEMDEETLRAISSTQGLIPDVAGIAIWCGKQP
jgi:hypothetical protein